MKSYPKYRRKNLESQLPFISNQAARDYAIQTLATLQAVIHANHPRCNYCVADCMQCVNAADLGGYPKITLVPAEQGKFTD